MTTTHTTPHPTRITVTPPPRRVPTSIDLTTQQHRFLETFTTRTGAPSMSAIAHILITLTQHNTDVAQCLIDIIFDPDSPPEVTMNGVENKKRFTVSLLTESHTFLRLFAAHNSTKVAKLVRAAVYLLNNNTSLQELVAQELAQPQGAPTP